MALIGDLRQSTAATIVLGPFVNSTDGDTAEPGLTIAQADVRLYKNGGSVAQKNDTSSCTHTENGDYVCALNATDTNTLGRLTIRVTKAGALKVRQDYRILPDYEYDAIYGEKMLRGILSYGTAQGATSTTLQLPASETFADNTLAGATVVAKGSTQGYAQSRAALSNVGSTDTITVDAWTVTPSGTITEAVLVGAPASATILPDVNVSKINGTTITGDGSGTPFGV